MENDHRDLNESSSGYRPKKDELSQNKQLGALKKILM